MHHRATRTRGHRPTGAIATVLSSLLMTLLTTRIVESQVPRTPPAPLPLRPAALPPFQETTLANGVRVVLVENHRTPTLVFRLSMSAGNAFDPAGKAGAASMVAGLLTKGAGSRTADQIAAAIENAGGSLTAVTDDDFLNVFGTVLSAHTPLAFELLGDIVARPTFAEPEFALARTQTLSGLQLSSASPAVLASRFFREGLYGAHPYGITATPTSVRAITRADLVQFHASRLRPRGALLVVAGDITLAKLTTLTNRAFAGWTGAPAAAAPPVAPPTRARTEIVLVHRPGSVQSNVLVGNLAVGPADAFRLPAELAVQVLGGGSDGRLFKTLREQKGWTYGAYASLSRPLGIGRFEANTEVRTAVTDSALTELLAQLTRIGTEPMPVKELDDTRGGMVGSFPLAIETSQGLAAIVAFIKAYGLPANYLQTYRPNMLALTGAQVAAAARQVIRPSQALIVIVGDGTVLYETLARIAPVSIRSVDGDVMQPSDLTATQRPATFDRALLKASRDSFVIAVQGQPLGHTVSTLEANDGGWTYSEATNVNNGAALLRSTLTTNASLDPISLQQSGSVQGQQVATSIAFAGGKATGSAQNASPSGPQSRKVDVAIPAGTLASEALRLVVPVLPWTDGASFTFTVFTAATGTVQPVTLRAVGSETITVPAGTFDSWKIEQAGGATPAMIHLAKKEKRIVQSGTPGQPVLVQLAK